MCLAVLQSKRVQREVIHLIQHIIVNFVPINSFYCEACISSDLCVCVCVHGDSCVSMSSPSGLTPLTFRSQPHLSSSPRLQARVTAIATAAEDRACTKAASRVPGPGETGWTRERE